MRSLPRVIAVLALTSIPCLADDLSKDALVSTRVHAKMDDWQNSGLKLKKGSSYIVRARGDWRAGPRCNATDADGLNPYTALCARWKFGKGAIVKLYTISALIGRIGKDGEPFGVGKKLKFTASEDGPLFFRINDGAGKTKDNSGFLTVTVSPGKPSTYPAEEDAPAPRGEALADSPSSTTPGEAGSGIAGQRWAVVIGISEYEDSRIPDLRYARKDAMAVRDWLVSPDGGAYPPAHVKFLADEKATARNIRQALFSWLGAAIEEDIVTIYYAGHGSPDSPATPDNLFLLPHDVRYHNIASTGFPMWDIETALKRYIKARRVVVIADACHSGGVGEAFDLGRRGSPEDDANTINAGLQKLSNIGDGVAVISASSDSQLSYEGEQYGGGHGAFTFFLLKGLRGEADYNTDQQVTLGELIPFLSEQVRRATRNAQTPVISGRFDPAMSIGK